MKGKNLSVNKFNCYEGMKTLIMRDETPFKRDLFFKVLSQENWARPLYFLAEKNLGWNLLFNNIFFWAHFLFLKIPKKGTTLCFPKMTNEQKSLTEYIPKSKWSRRKIRLSLMGFISVRALPSPLKVFRISYQLCCKHPPYISLRALEYLAYYSRIRNSATNKSAVVITTDSNPHGLALLKSAQSLGLKKIFISHGHPNPPAPRLSLDTAILYGPYSMKFYRIDAKTKTKVLFNPSKKFFIPIKKTIHYKCVGIALSKNFSLDELENTTTKVRRIFGSVMVILRPHPSTKIKKPLYRFSEKNHCEIDTGQSLVSFFSEIDLLLADDTTTHLNALLMGIPSLYMGSLDRYGFVSEGLVLPFSRVHSKNDIDDFYNASLVAQKLRNYLDIDSCPDASVLKIREALKVLEI